MVTLFISLMEAPTIASKQGLRVPEGGFAYGNIVTYSPENSHIPWEMLVGCWNGSFWNGPLFRGLSLVSGGEQFSSRIFCPKLFDLHIFAKQPIPFGSREVERGVWSDQFMDLIFMDWSLTRYHRISMDWSLQMHRMDFPWRWRSIYKVSTVYFSTPKEKQTIFCFNSYHRISLPKGKPFLLPPQKTGENLQRKTSQSFSHWSLPGTVTPTFAVVKSLVGLEFLRKTCGNIETNERISIISKTTRLLLILVLFMM